MDRIGGLSAYNKASRYQLGCEEVYVMPCLHYNKTYYRVGSLEQPVERWVCDECGKRGPTVVSRTAEVDSGPSVCDDPDGGEEA